MPNCAVSSKLAYNVSVRPGRKTRPPGPFHEGRRVAIASAFVVNRLRGRLFPRRPHLARLQEVLYLLASNEAIPPIPWIFVGWHPCPAPASLQRRRYVTGSGGRLMEGKKLGRGFTHRGISIRRSPGVTCPRYEKTPHAPTTPEG